MLHLETAIEKFSNAHKLLHPNLHDEDDIHESNDYFNTEMDRIADLKQNVNECNERLMLVSDMHNIRPEDSVSSVGLRQKSHARNISQRSMAGFYYYYYYTILDTPNWAFQDLITNIKFYIYKSI